MRVFVCVCTRTHVCTRTGHLCLSVYLSGPGKGTGYRKKPLFNFEILTALSSLFLAGTWFPRATALLDLVALLILPSAS